VGFTLAMFGAGMVAGALLTSRVVARLPFGRAIQVGPAVAVVAAAVMAATLAVPNASGAAGAAGAGLAALSFFLFGAGPMVWVITSTTLRQSVAPASMLGRVSAVFLTVNTGARPLGAALGGVVGAAWGEPACLLLALAGFALQAAIIFASRVSGLRRLPVAA
jgi:predicted MFS family arabinose efflux permease